MIENEEEITLTEFKAWLAGLIRGKQGAIPDLEDWKAIRETLDKVTEKADGPIWPVITEPPYVPYTPYIPPVSPSVPYIPPIPIYPYWDDNTGTPWWLVEPYCGDELGGNVMGGGPNCDTITTSSGLNPTAIDIDVELEGALSQMFDENG